MSSDEEVDYMSDAFLKSICGKDDVRPGLIQCHAQQHSHKKAVKKMASDERNKTRNPSMKVKEALRREDGLNKPLDCDNKGFKMLQKLGFKPGSGLGRSGEGRVEPIAMEVKTDRQGLGRKSSLEEISRIQAKYRIQAREKLLNVDDFRVRKAGQAAEKKASLDLMKSQRVCWELDSKEYIDEPAESWFWPENKLPNVDDEAGEKEDDEKEEETKPSLSSYSNREEVPEREEGVEEYKDTDDGEEFSTSEKLEMLTLYLRRTYLYCVWCGHEFDDEKDLQQDCPGPTREDH